MSSQLGRAMSWLPTWLLGHASERLIPWSTFLAAAAFAPFVHSATPAPVVLGKADLIRIALTEADAVKPDPFTRPSPSKRHGAKFAFTVFFKKSDEPEALRSAWWDYDLDLGVLRLRLPSAPSDFVIADSTKVTGARVGQNAFGVRVRVEQQRHVKVSLQALERPKPDTGFYEVDLNLPGPAARVEALSAVAKIEGELVSSDGEVAHCDDGEATGTIDDPVDLTYRYCGIYGRIDRVQFLSSDKSVIGMWRLDDPREDRPHQ